MITDVSSFDEAGAQLVRLDAHFQTDYRARRVRRHHVLSSPRMRVLKGMWRSVAAGEGKGSASRPFRAQLAQRFGRFSCQNLSWGLYFFGPLSTAFAQQAGLSKSVECCPRYIGGSSDCWRLAFPTPFPDSWRAFKVRPRSYFGRLSSSSRKSNTDIVRIPSLS